MNELIAYSATQQARLIRERRVSSRELVAAHLERIAAINPKINAAIQVLTESALAEAAAADASEPRGPLHGVPFSIKDSIELAGTVCTAGTLGRSGAAPSTEDATLVARLRRAGGIPIAKTNLPSNTAFRGFGGPQVCARRRALLSCCLPSPSLPVQSPCSAVGGKSV